MGTSDGDGAVRRQHGKGLLTEEVEVAKNTNKNKTARHKKVRAMALIPLEILNAIVLYFSNHRIYVSAFYIEDKVCSTSKYAIYTSKQGGPKAHIP